MSPPSPAEAGCRPNSTEHSPIQTFLRSPATLRVRPSAVTPVRIMLSRSIAPFGSTGKRPSLFRPAMERSFVPMILASCPAVTPTGRSEAMMLILIKSFLSTREHCARARPALSSVRRGTRADAWVDGHLYASLDRLLCHGNAPRICTPPASRPRRQATQAKSVLPLWRIASPCSSSRSPGGRLRRRNRISARSHSGREKSANRCCDARKPSGTRAATFPYSQHDQGRAE